MQFCTSAMSTTFSISPRHFPILISRQMHIHLLSPLPLADPMPVSTFSLSSPTTQATCFPDTTLLPPLPLPLESSQQAYRPHHLAFTFSIHRSKIHLCHCVNLTRTLARPCHQSSTTSTTATTSLSSTAVPLRAKANATAIQQATTTPVVHHCLGHHASSNDDDSHNLSTNNPSSPSKLLPDL